MNGRSVRVIKSDDPQSATHDAAANDKQMIRAVG